MRWWQPQKDQNPLANVKKGYKEPYKSSLLQVFFTPEDDRICRLPCRKLEELLTIKFIVLSWVLNPTAFYLITIPQASLQEYIRKDWLASYFLLPASE